MRARSKAIVTMLVFVLIIPFLLITIAGTSAIEGSKVIQSTGVIKYDDWPMYHHDSSNTGYVDSNAPKTNHTLWTYKVPSMTQSGGGVAIANGKIFVPHMEGVDVLDATTGTFMIRYNAQYVNSVPAIAYGKVFFTGEGFEPMVFAFEEDSGSKIWTFRTPGILWRSSPIVANGRVFVSDDTNTLYAINASSGKSLWNSTKATWAFTSSVAGGLVFSLDGYGTYVALNESTGEVVWSFTPDYPGYPEGRMPVAIANGTVFAIGAVRYAYALNQTSGSVIWRQRYGAWGEDFITTPSVGYGMVFLGCSDGKIYAINQTTGSLIWTSTSLGRFEATPAVADEMIFVSVGTFGSDGNIFALNKTNGDIVWRSYVGQRLG
jgi:outer membrane protein assembly factor BamB